MVDMVVIGGGAAGLGAMGYALSRQLDATLIVESPGGKAGVVQHVRHPSGELPIGAETVQQLEQQIARYPQRVVADRVLDVTLQANGFLVETQHHGTLAARTVIVATGAMPVQLNVPGARELINHGVGYSSTTHAQRLRGKSVAIVGATERALRGALELADIGAQVQLLTESGLGHSALAAAVRADPRIMRFDGARLLAIVGEPSVEHIQFLHGDQESWLRVDAVFADLGLLPNSAAVRKLVALDPQGFIIVDGQRMTSQPGVFAAGDVTTAFAEHTLVALGDGMRAAVHAYQHILATRTAATNTSGTANH